MPAQPPPPSPTTSTTSSTLRELTAENLALLAREQLPPPSYALPRFSRRWRRSRAPSPESQRTGAEAEDERDRRSDAPSPTSGVTTGPPATLADAEANRAVRSGAPSPMSVADPSSAAAECPGPFSPGSRAPEHRAWPPQEPDTASTAVGSSSSGADAPPPGVPPAPTLPPSTVMPPPRWPPCLLSHSRLLALHAYRARQQLMGRNGGRQQSRLRPEDIPWAQQVRRRRAYDVAGVRHPPGCSCGSSFEEGEEPSCLMARFVGPQAEEQEMERMPTVMSERDESEQVENQDERVPTVMSEQDESEQGESEQDESEQDESEQDENWEVERMPTAMRERDESEQVENQEVETTPTVTTERIENGQERQSGFKCLLRRYFDY
ncbi:hypothetical protein O988_07691 [Pseudogymnoascus sp. VKM F-3808]|nr:hypothetical protein O988_07691 [Pseudogymnoascus sp. VKM F-3808]